MRTHLWYQTISAPNKITVNGKTMHNLPYFINDIVKTSKTIAESSRPGVIHGDLGLSNILYDPANRIFKFIDPRGNFGKKSVFGDVRYDIAKLRHSIAGGYDFIVADLFQVKEQTTGYIFELYEEQYNKEVRKILDEKLLQNGFNLTEIKFIEGLLFLSMIPLHMESVDRQKAMYITGVQLLNESLL